MKYEKRLTFAYYSVTFWDFKSLQSVLKTWKVLKKRTFNFFSFFFNIEILFFMITNSDFLLFFPIISGTTYCWKYCFLTIFFPKSRNTVTKIFTSCPPANAMPPSPPHPYSHLVTSRKFLQQPTTTKKNSTKNCTMTHLHPANFHNEPLPQEMLCSDQEIFSSNQLRKIQKQPNNIQKTITTQQHPLLLKKNPKTHHYLLPFRTIPTGCNRSHTLWACIHQN